MAKYRIKEVQAFYATRYIPQRKTWFGWLTLYWGVNIYDLEIAKSIINERRHKEKTTIHEIE